MTGSSSHGTESGTSSRAVCETVARGLCVYGDGPRRPSHTPASTITSGPTISVAHDATRISTRSETCLRSSLQRYEWKTNDARLLLVCSRCRRKKTNLSTWNSAWRMYRRDESGSSSCDTNDAAAPSRPTLALRRDRRPPLPLLLLVAPRPLAAGLAGLAGLAGGAPSAAVRSRWRLPVSAAIQSRCSLSGSMLFELSHRLSIVRKKKEMTPTVAAKKHAIAKRIRWPTSKSSRM